MWHLITISIIKQLLFNQELVKKKGGEAQSLPQVPEKSIWCLTWLEKIMSLNKLLNKSV